AAATLAAGVGRGTLTCSRLMARAEPRATRTRTAVASATHSGSDALPGRARRPSADRRSGPPSGRATSPALDQRPLPSRVSIANDAFGSPSHFTPTRSGSPLTTFDQPGPTV